MPYHTTPDGGASLSQEEEHALPHLATRGSTTVPGGSQGEKSP